MSFPSSHQWLFLSPKRLLSFARTFQIHFKTSELAMKAPVLEMQTWFDRTSHNLHKEAAAVTGVSKAIEKRDVEGQLHVHILLFRTQRDVSSPRKTGKTWTWLVYSTKIALISACGWTSSWLLHKLRKALRHCGGRETWGGKWSSSSFLND